MSLFNNEHGRAFLVSRILKYSTPVPESGCLVWCGWTNEYGYGKISVRNKSKWVHRVAYEIAYGPIPEGMDVDHLCRVRCCVNPMHLEAVSRRVNLLRGETVTAKHASQTHCKRGHPLSGGNLRIEDKGMGLQARQCRECDKIRVRERVEKKKVVRNGKTGFEVYDVVV